MDLWLARLVLTHHRHHWLQHLPSAMLLRARVSSSFLLVVFFSGGLPCALVRLGLELLSSSLFLSRYSVRVALFIWPTGSKSGCLDCNLIGVVVGQSPYPYYWDSWPLLSYGPTDQPSLPDHLENRLIWVDSTKVIPPLAWCRMSFECIVGIHNLPATLVTLSLQLWNLTGTAWEC